ncbi:hypothetical protein JTE90_014345 [Oedothorax gibbosus]|uniref:Uncharacterized protein n=1 Tax=Oedothorax gibbosus TaxID=931172 RepID=A0AAV6TEB7_9ARAC|nr:hypothetical protein JTE90_014345 [Oedothorax gibbosus]
MRIKRPRRIINYAARGLEKRGFVVFPRAPLWENAKVLGNRTSGYTRREKAFVIDAQILGGVVELPLRHPELAVGYGRVTLPTLFWPAAPSGVETSLSSLQGALSEEFPSSTVFPLYCRKPKFSHGNRRAGHS